MLINVINNSSRQQILDRHPSLDKQPNLRGADIIMDVLFHHENVFLLNQTAVSDFDQTEEMQIIEKYIPTR